MGYRCQESVGLLALVHLEPLVREDGFEPVVLQLKREAINWLKTFVTVIIGLVPRKKSFLLLTFYVAPQPSLVT